MEVIATRLQTIRPVVHTVRHQAIAILVVALHQEVVSEAAILLAEALVMEGSLAENKHKIQILFRIIDLKIKVHRQNC